MSSGPRIASAFLPRAHVFAALLRPRAAMALVSFLALGLAVHERLGNPPLELVAALLLLGASYISATSANDIADVAIDRVNHPRRGDRPLASGRAGELEVRRVHRAASIATIAAGSAMGIVGLLVAITSVVFNRWYSTGARPVSRRPVGAPILLTLAYVGIPYATALAAIGARPNRADVVFLASALLLFGSRIVLKDVRDRAGDELAGKRTLLALHGRRTICALSATLVTGGVAIAGSGLADRVAPVVLLALLPFLAVLLALLVLLDGARDPDEELMAIAAGVRIGNVLVAGLIGALVLAADGAPVRHHVLLLTALFAWSTMSVTVAWVRSSERHRAGRSISPRTDQAAA